MIYEDLVKQYQPRPCHTEKQAKVLQGHIDILLDKASLNEDEQDYLTMLGLVMWNYEERYVEPITMTRWEYFQASVEQGFYNLVWRWENKTW